MTPQEQTVTALDDIEAQLRHRFEELAAIPVDPASLMALLVELGEEYNAYYYKAQGIEED